ncbi:MAG: DNA primase [Candidatus Liptonbacteria bacterium]|nr:DNA primase [Candidatus Liptonbacteria bacterium]
MSTPVEQIKAKLDIVELIKGYVALTPAGKNFKGLCPFHKEKSPSFMVSPERQSWHCFGCNLGGDLFSFLMRFENIEFPEALRMLADRTGVELRRLNPAEYKVTGLLYDLQNLAKKFFQIQLAQSAIPRKYLEERGLLPETIATFELGWAPAESDPLTVHLLNAGYSLEDLIRAGLTLKSERGMAFDRFRGRIMFPLHNHLGKPVGFTGRILPQLDTGQTGKYVNSPETPIFNKSKLLYGFWKSKDTIRETGSVFLVEGQMDFLMSYQAGVRQVVAASGTALTADHLTALRRLADKLLLSFDSDEAGWRAGERAIDLAEQLDWNVQVVTLGGYKDPAEAAQANPESLRAALAQARPAMAVYFEHYLGTGRGLDYRDRDNLKKLRIVLGKLKNMASAVERNRWLMELAKLTALGEKVLIEEMERIETAATIERLTPVAEDGSSGSAARKFTRWELLTQDLLALARGSSAGDINPNYLAPGYREVFDLLRSGQSKSTDLVLDELVGLIVLKSRDPQPGEIELLKQEMRKEYVREERKRLTLAIRNAEARGNYAELEAALADLGKLEQV